jgi:hypothetical protein
MRAALDRAVTIVGDIFIVVFVAYSFFAFVDVLRTMWR